MPNRKEVSTFNETKKKAKKTRKKWTFFVTDLLLQSTNGVRGLLIAIELRKI
jgi:hypothetical protein